MIWSKVEWVVLVFGGDWCVKDLSAHTSSAFVNEES